MARPARKPLAQRGHGQQATQVHIAAMLQRLEHAAFAPLGLRTPVAERAALLRRAGRRAGRTHWPEFCGAAGAQKPHKTWGDAVAEVREAVDFCRYYADQADCCGWPMQLLPGPTGESTPSCACTGRGVFVCISPWNFPLAIFAGQVVAALVAGNTVAAKPAEQTPAGRRSASWRCCTTCRRAKPTRWLMLHGLGETVGAAAGGRQPRCAGVCFTGSDRRGARLINRTLAAKDGPIVPLDCRNRRPERDGGRQHGAARTGGRRRGAKRLSLGRPALLGAAPAVRCMQATADGGDRDAQRRAWPSCAWATRPSWPPTSGR